MLIFLERTSIWAAAFRRQQKRAKQGAMAICETRSLPHCQRELAASPFSVVAVEVLPQNIAVVARSLREWSVCFPHARFIALAARGLEEHDLLLRESGALEVAYSPRKLLPLVRLIGRHLARARSRS